MFFLTHPSDPKRRSFGYKVFTQTVSNMLAIRYLRANVD
jgi:hypothetical protein